MILLKDIFDSLKDMACDAGYFIMRNLYNVYILLDIACPYLMLYLGADLYEQRGKFILGGEVFIPLCIFFVSSLIHRVANKNNVGDSIPVPRKRFTEETQDGYSIKQDDINEIIIYLGEVEDYLEKKKLL